MDEHGHEVLARAILKAWGVESWKQVSDELRKTVKEKENCCMTRGYRTLAINDQVSKQGCRWTLRWKKPEPLISAS